MALPLQLSQSLLISVDQHKVYALNPECARLLRDQLEELRSPRCSSPRLSQEPGRCQAAFEVIFILWGNHGNTPGTMCSPPTRGTGMRQAVPWEKEVGPGELENQSRVPRCRARVKGHRKAQRQGSDFCGGELGEGGLFRSTHRTWTTRFLNMDRCCVLVSSVSPQKPSD